MHAIFSDRQKKFKLYETHRRVFPWLAPANLDKDILTEMKNHLVRKLKEAIEWHQATSRAERKYTSLSSPEGGNSPEEVSLFLSEAETRLVAFINARLSRLSDVK
ncbi:hypothetical protein QCA50_006851 [Cerrena zonata]|uniref:Uncharacterized protein n=1 Tax=Cerrena zonata TaxID=2478898 RepID=A0AAW0GGA6_9APHY